MVAPNVTQFNIAGLAALTGTGVGTILEFDLGGNVLPTAGTYKTVASIDTAIAVNAPYAVTALQVQVTALQVQVTALQVQVTALQVQVTTLQARTFNVQAERSDDVIQWPQHGTVLSLPYPTLWRNCVCLVLDHVGPCLPTTAFLSVALWQPARRRTLAHHIIGLPRGSLKLS